MGLVQIRTGKDFQLSGIGKPNIPPGARDDRGETAPSIGVNTDIQYGAQRIFLQGKLCHYRSVYNNTEIAQGGDEGRPYCPCDSCGR